MPAHLELARKAILPYFDDGFVQIYNARCEEVLPHLDTDALVSDPPYGRNFNTDYTRFQGGLHHAGRKNFQKISGDDRPFDPTHLLSYEKIVLWGANNFASHLPPGTWLIWNKRRLEKLGKFLSDGEVAWMRGGYGVYIFNHVWDGFDRASERGRTLHPTQKPVALMQWCIEKLKLPEGSVIVDPYCGSGSTLEAARRLGHPSIGIELDPEYCRVAASRFDGVLF